MTPSRTRKAWPALLLFSALPARAAETACKSVQAANQIFYVADSDYAACQEMRKKGEGAVPLWIDVVKDGKRSRVQSDAELSCETAKGKAAVCRVTVDKSKGGAYDIPVKLDAAPSVPPQVQDAVERPPQGVSPAIWSVVVNSRAKIPRGQWEPAAKALQLLSQKNPKAFEKLVAGGHVTYDKVLAALKFDVASGHMSEERMARHAGEVAEAAAPPETAGVSGPPKSGPAPKAQTQPAGQDTAGPDANNPFNKLAKLMGREDVQKSLEERIVAFLTQPTGADSFISPKIEPEQREQALKLLEGGVVKFVEAKAKEAKGPGELAALYFLLGEPAPKPWIEENKLTDMAGDRPERKNFAAALKGFTVGSGVEFDPANSERGGPYKGDQGSPDTDAWTAAFLKTAVDKAFDAWNAGKTPDQQIPREFPEKPEGPGGPGVTPGPGGPGTVMARNFTADEMYGGGAVVWRHSVPGEESATPRTLSFKIYSDVTSQGPPPVWRHRLGVFDVSRRGSYVGQYFNIDANGSSSFRLDDRPGHENSVRYKLSVVDGRITFVPLDRKGKESGAALDTTVSKLYDLRRDQADKIGFPVELNGRKFKVLGQGGWYGALLYFPLDDKGRVLQEGMGPAQPSAYAVVSKVDGSGATVRAGEQMGVGWIPNQEGKYDKAYDLFWNPKSGLYEAKEVKTPTKHPELKDPNVASSSPTTTSPTSPTSPTGPKPTTGGVATSGEMTKCGYDAEMPLTPKMVRYNAGDSWSRYTEPEPKGSGGNNTYLCLYGNMILFVPGLIGKGDIGMQGDSLVVKRVALEEKGGTAFLRANELEGFALKSGDASATTGAGDRQVAAVEEYYLPSSGIDARMRLPGKDPPLLTIGRLAWASRLRTGPSDTFKVYLHKDHKEQWAAEIRSAILQFGAPKDRSGASHATYCTRAGTAEKIDAYVQTALADPKLNERLVEPGDKDHNKQPPHILFKCVLSDESQSPEAVLVAPEWMSSNDHFRLKDLRQAKK